MARGKSSHRRRAKNVDTLKRKKPIRSTYARVLIITEGQKTEPNYFNEIRDYYELNSANIEISGECGSNPASVLKYAKKRYQEERDKGNAFDKVFCVIDKDCHVDYSRVLNEIESAKPADTYIAINSVPCFEYWILLHYVYTSQSFVPVGNRSACACLIHELEKYSSNYTKGRQGIFNELVDRLELAKKNAERALQEARQNRTDNPITKVHHLVEFLQKIKR